VEGNDQYMVSCKMHSLTYSLIPTAEWYYILTCFEHIVYARLLLSLKL
jgi:hypothetical protein